MSVRILRKERINAVTVRMVLDAPRAAAGAKAGQFVILRIDECGERIPLTVAAADVARGEVTIIFQEVGRSTKRLASLGTGDALADLLGPLGKAAHFGRVGSVVFVAGGVGIAEALPVARYAKEAGNSVTAVIGARTKDLLILEDEMRKTVDRCFAVTDDGSSGVKGLVTQPLKDLLDQGRYDLAYCVGPDIMMKAVCDLTRQRGLKTLVSLDANMLDATGMCATCRVTVGGEVKFTCVDGPEFDGHALDWDEFLKRQKRFVQEEEASLDHYEHACRMTT